MDHTCDVIVLGVGAMGAAACWHLARRGVRVLGIERFAIAHPHGSSGGRTRLVRLTYYEHPDYVPLLRRAYEGWDAIGGEAGVRLLHRTGGLYLGGPGSGFIAGSRRSADEHALAYDVLDAPAIVERFPQFVVPEHFTGMFERDAGFVYSERSIAAFAEAAARHGAVIHAGERVVRWSADDRGVRVQTDRGVYEAGRLILAAGAWTAGLLPELTPLLRVTRQVLGWVDPPVPERFAAEVFPCWGIEDDAPGFEGIYYGFPLTDAGEGLKLAHHAAGEAADADTLDRRPRSADEADFRTALTKYLPGAVGPTRSMHVCMYTSSPDHHFIVGSHPTRANVVIACGFSGHGFKFAPVIGEALADLAMAGRTPLPIGFLAPDRFGAMSAPTPGA